MSIQPSFIKNLFLFFIATFIIIPIFPNKTEARQNGPDVEFVRLFNALQKDLPRERIYLHTDRQWYFHGDRIWFSAYLTAGPFNAPSLVSTILYVELYSPDGDMIERMAFKNEEGRSHGSILIKNDNISGIYRLKAYTGWSLNFGEHYGFSRDIPVHSDAVRNEGSASNDFDVSFYPEGGDLVAGIGSIVGFKAVGSDGLGREVTGTVYDQNDMLVAKIESEHLGMGAFTFTPEGANNYYATIEGQRFDLPAAKKEGVVFTISENEYDQYFIQARGSEQYYNGSFLVFSHVRGEVYLASILDLINGSGFTVAPKNMFPSGVVHFTVLDNDGNPLAERLKFNLNPSDSVHTSTQLNKDAYGVRDEVNLSLGLKDSEGESADATASITVFDDRITAFKPYASNIETKLLLESEVVGHVENPGYYLGGTGDRGHAADLLMLTQGWRAFDMEDVQKAEDIELFSLPEKGIKVQGRILAPFRSRGLANATVAFSLGEEDEEMQILTTDEDGYFTIPDLDIVGSQPISIRANNSDGGDNVRIRLSEPYSYLPVDSSNIHQSAFKSVSEGSLSERSESTSIQVEQFAEAQMRGELEEITISAEKETDDQFERDLRAGAAGSQRVDLDERPELTSLSVELIINQIPGVTANPATGVAIRTGATSLSGNPSPLIFLDGIETQWSTIRSLSSTDIKTINVFRRSTELASYGARGTGGVLSIRTRRGSGAAPSSRGFETAFIEGYQIPTRFYSPKYGVSIPRDTEEEDNRITLHWEPDVEIEDGEASLRFWTNDVLSSYRVLIEGITEFGIPFRKTLVFDVD